MFIANTTTEKLLQAILTEQRKTNELLSLCSMRKDTEIEKAKIEEVQSKPRKPRGTPAKRRKSNGTASKRSDDTIGVKDNS